jgi:hypothetical protein
VATPEPLESSRRLSEAALAERERLLRRLEQLDRRRAKHTRQLRELDAERARLSSRVELLDELLPAAPARHLQSVEASSEEPARGYLRGAAIRREAVRLLAESEAPEVAIHYTEWLAKFKQAGFGIESRDPAATFLTQISRSAVVARADRPGTYILDLDAPMRLREQLDRLHAELLALRDGQQTLEAIVSTRERRDQVFGEISRTERALEEALSTLGS